MFDNELFLIRIAYLKLVGMTLTARVEAMDCKCATTRMKALQMLGVVPQAIA